MGSDPMFTNFGGLELQTQGKLDLTWAAGAGGAGIDDRRYCSEGSQVGKIRIRETVLRPIEDVERFGAEFKSDAFGDLSLLGSAQVDLPEIGPAQSISWKSSPRSTRRCLESGRIEPCGRRLVRRIQRIPHFCDLAVIEVETS